MTDADELYKSMATHPDTGPVLDMLELVEPVDEFSKALCLVRDCFAQGGTLRLLSRNKLRGLLRSRIMLMNAYHDAVVATVPGAKTFVDAVANHAADRAKLTALKQAYEKEAAKLMARPLKKS